MGDPLAARQARAGVERGTRWRYFRSFYNGPTLIGVLLGSRWEPWLAKYVT